LLSTISDYTQGQSCNGGFGILLGVPVFHHAGKLGDLGYPPTIFFSVEDNTEGFAGIGRNRDSCQLCSTRRGGDAVAEDYFSSELLCQE